MHDRHLSPELLEAIHRGERSPSDLTTVAMAHLFETCPRCREVFEAWQREVDEEPADDFLARYDAAFDRLRTRLRGETLKDERHSCLHHDLEEDDDSRAQAAMEDLLALPNSQRLRTVEEDRSRYSGPSLASLLLEESRRNLPARPRESHKLARLARAVIQHCDPTPRTTVLYSRSLAHQANSLRTQGDLRTANELLEVAKFLLKPHGGGDRLTRAELDSFEGSLRRAQQRLGDAENLYSRSIMAYAMEGRRLEVANNLLALGIVLRENSEDDRAIAATRQALEIAEEERLPSLVLFARHNLAYFLHKAGETAEARQVFEETGRLYDDHGDSGMHLRRLWLSGHLDRAEGHLQEAEDAYRFVRDAFHKTGSGYYAALAALDLATLYAEQGRTAELKRVAEELVPFFEAGDLHREAATALILFQDAVRAEQVTLRYLVELIRYLERARLDPALQFRVPA